MISQIRGVETCATRPSKVPYSSKTSVAPFLLMVVWMSMCVCVSFFIFRSVVGEYTVASRPGLESCS